MHKIIGDDDNYNDNRSVQTAVLCAFMSSRCGATLGCDGGDGVHVWNVVGNILKKQQQTSDKGCPPAWWLGELLTTQHCISLLL